METALGLARQHRSLPFGSQPTHEPEVSKLITRYESVARVSGPLGDTAECES
jgi:hypothetical protein